MSEGSFPSGTSGSGVAPTSSSSVHDREATVLELYPLKKLFAHYLRILIFLFIHCVSPKNAYDKAIIEEFIIINTRVERNVVNISTAQTTPTSAPVGQWASSNRSDRSNEPITILKMKFLLRARNDFLRRLLPSLESDNETLERRVKSGPTDRSPQTNLRGPLRAHGTHGEAVAASHRSAHRTSSTRRHCQTH